MSVSTSQFAGLALLVLVCLAAWMKGGASERLSAALVLGAMFLNLAIHAFAPKASQNFLLLGVDGVIALGLLIVALRYMRFWLGGAVMLQAVQFSLHAYYLVNEMRHDRNYAVVNNLVTYGLLLLILLGTVRAWRLRKSGK
jgi:hypothetical protein